MVPAPAVAQPCKPRAELAGDAAAVAKVGAELALLGVERGVSSPGCRGVFAQVELELDGGIAVAIRDGAKRSEGRVVSDAAMAASWIDSWLHDDLDGTSWLVASPRLVPGAVRVEQPPVVVKRSTFERFAVSAAFEQSWLSDASASGFTGHACVRVGRACVGGRARYAREPDREVNLTAMSRGHGAVLATASTSLSLGRMTVAPEVGVGIGWTSTRRLDTCVPDANMGGNVPDPNCEMNPMDPSCNMTPTPAVEMCTNPDGTIGATFGDDFSRTTIAPRLGAALRVSIPLFDRVWLDGIAAATYAPLGHGDPFTLVPDPTTTFPGGVSAEQVAIPGESIGALTLGVGLRIGAP